ncbi:hypothetical protein GPECTOR_54g233 [Gonium pectorale]|uniref:EF-hand domain-containing protein n=1 Tax=Gonium pectorale TaxID=33097 RepID=A0A150G6M1_GONPE|nr:hypothetical protein GPECTOR_54g233 [Gonium pectorale]|eukprot:KXZ45492.1 hypothetical protein GPECTOR_54g233 [Gonium pectorale]
MAEPISEPAAGVIHGDSRTSDSIRLSGMAGQRSSTLHRKLEKVDQNKDGVIEVSEIAAVVDEMLKEQQIGKIYKFMTIGLFIVVAVLIGALTGITWAIVQISKDTKVANSYSNNNYQFVTTKNDKAAVTGSVLLGVVGSLRHVSENVTANFTNSFNMGSRRRHRMLVSIDDYPADMLILYGTLDFPTVEQGCDIIRKGHISFQISHNSVTVGDGVHYSTVTVLEATGCDDLSSKEVTAIVSDGAFKYIIICRPGLVQDDSATALKCEVWQDRTGFDDTNNSDEADTTSPQARRRLSWNPRWCRHWSRNIGGWCDQCHDGYNTIIGTCAPRPCFPADATIEVIGRAGDVSAVRMDELQYGDFVRSRDRRTGKEVFREVYLFGHREADRTTPYVHVTAGGRTLVGSDGHFLPVCAQRCTEADLQAGTIGLENRRFRDVRAGDMLLLSAGDSSFTLASVSAVDVLMARGAYNPYVRGADLVVDGVVASPHSNWILDWAAPASMVRYLPYVYEILLAPVYGLYRMVGPVTAEWLAHGLGLAESGAESGLGYYIVIAGMAAPLAAVLAAGRAASKQLLL